MNNSRRKRISKIADALNELKGQIDELAGSLREHP